MDGSCLHFSPFMYHIVWYVQNRYFDWNTETIGSSNKIQTICEHQKNYIPFYYIFGDVYDVHSLSFQTADVTVDSCSDPEKGLAKTKAFSIYFAMSFEKYNSTIPHDWIKEAEKIVEEFQEESKFWDVSLSLQGYKQTYFMSSYGLSNEVERGTLQTMTKLVVSIILVVIMLVFALHEDSWGISIGLGRFEGSFLYSHSCLNLSPSGMWYGLGNLSTDWIAVDNHYTCDCILGVGVGCR